MNIREIELPGIGQKFEIITKNKDKVVIIIHDDGRREIYHFDDDDYEESISNITFNDSEARRVAAILGGMVYKPQALESVEMAFAGLVIEWFKVEPNAPVVSQTIGGIDLRNKYGVNVIAIMKKSLRKVISPGPDALIEAGDTLVISGERSELKSFIKEMLTSEG
ncbi:potassium:proton antiporter [Bacillus canaveralius]|uniref:Potassium:proton antiporter n=1 Tax=Bacillus canaveralius TaxID=1403243 RepID=A0A2N5GH25_9BACI|nr:MULTISPECIES: cation:proton antiporter regulatory subunit [Bacillus]PLR80065.1 potassium:proton antiporter [Bacillus canaveralius]PLR81897.1 potassium:proton antiporter [Bacillus sp. V33-4]PLR89038.1 potassium:proton antiporter [Bacillus canaveralius]RSK47243.1 potassium:proton antiporter [Bacillus canaveralius]